MRCLYFGFYLTLYELISPAVPFLFCFVLFSVTFGSTLLGVAENLFPGGTLFACYLYLLFCSANRSYTSYSSCGTTTKRAYGHTTSLFVMAHRNVGLSSSCMLDLLRMSFSCTAAVLFLVQIEHLYSGPSFSLCCPPPIAPSPDRTCAPAQPSTHFCSKTQMSTSTQTREDWTCFAQ